MSESSYGLSAEPTTVFMEKAAMAQFDVQKNVLIGPCGQLEISQDDEIIHKFLMLQEGECDGPGPLQAAAKYGFSKQRYYQLRTAFGKHGTEALQSRKRGPRTHYRRTAELVRQVIRHRFLDRDASAQVIAQKLVQGGWKISIRSVVRVLEEYGLQKKTPQIPTARRCRSRRGADQP